ncbi:hypothetical protein HJFPF1_09113 [Paramyrothecium foliicola]|nr:hypothetical protein HJFPF1_09113 [Paramyrothecium foliicola]
MSDRTLDLYGGGRAWDTAQWETSDDRVRGGSSRSHLTVVDHNRARFHGHLDTKTLGGAGFASQHTAGEIDLDLSAYHGLIISIAKPASDAKANNGSSKRYAVTIKDDLPKRRPDGRERAGLSWEADFTWGPDDDSQDIFLPWDQFKATYRGRDKPDAEPLNLTGIKRIGLMMRSFFGEQDGDFQIDLQAIRATQASHDSLGAGNSPMPTGAGRGGAPGAETTNHDEQDEDDLDMQKRKAATPPQDNLHSRPWWKQLFCGLL